MTKKEKRSKQHRHVDEHKITKHHKRKRHDSSDEEDVDARSVRSSGEIAVKEVRSLALIDKDLEDVTHAGKNVDSNSVIVQKNVVRNEEIKTDKKDFFAKLLKEESRKMVGSVHAIGKKDSGSGVVAAASGDWECVKCSATNMKHAMQCHKCRALKKMTEWR